MSELEEKLIKAQSRLAAMQVAFDTCRCGVCQMNLELAKGAVDSVTAEISRANRGVKL